MTLPPSGYQVSDFFRTFLCVAFSVGFSLPVSAVTKSEWFPCSPSPTLENLSGVVFNGSTIIATGDQGTVMTSSDGEQWSRIRITHSAGDMIDLWQVASSGKEVVVASNVPGVVWTSTDGLAWTAQSTGIAAMLYRLTFSSGRYVALATTVSGRSQGTVILTSTDGVTWNTQNISNGGLSLHSAIWTGKQYVAIGIQNSKWEALKSFFGKPAKIDTAVTAVSSDGQSWSVTELPTGSTRRVGPKALAWNGSLFVLGCDSGMIYTSTDGLIWLLQKESPTEVSLMNVVWGGAMFIAVGRDMNRATNGKAAIWTSPDGTNWSKDKTAEGNATLSNATWAGNQFVAVGFGGQIQVSAGSGEWQRKSPISGGGNLTKMTSNGSLFVAVGHQTNLTSVDGKQWTPHPVPADFVINGVAWNGKRFVAVGAKGVVFTSSDGKNWMLASAGTTEDLKDVVWTGTRMVCVGIDNSKSPSGALAWESSDGSKWTPCPVPNDVGGLCAVVWTGRQLVAVGHRGSVLSSPDGIIWSKQRGGGMLPDIEAIAWSGKTFAAVGRAGAMSGGKAILCSQDGITWTDYPGTGSVLLFGIAWAGDRFIAVGEQGVVNVSDNGYSWTYDSICTTQSLAHVYWNGKAVYAVGAGGVIISAIPIKR